MFHLLRIKFLFPILASVFATTACKTSQDSQVKDIGYSPEDLAQPSPVMFQDGDWVNYGECPVGSASINRQCPGLTLKFKPLTSEVFNKSFIDALVAGRAAGVNVAEKPEVKILKDKVQRLKDKLNSGTLSAATATAFQTQIADLEKELSDPDLQLTDDEKKILLDITTALAAGKDIAFDEGEKLYELSAQAFIGPNSVAEVNNCKAGTVSAGPGCWVKGKEKDSCTVACSKINLVFDPVTISYAGSAGTDQGCKEAGAALGIANFGSTFTGQSVGCIVSGGTTYRSTDATTADAVGYERICACM